MEILQNPIITLMGLWVAVSCMSGLLIFLIIKLFDFLFTKQSSTDRYHKSIMGLTFFFLMNIVSTYYFHKHPTQEVESVMSQEFKGEIQSVNELQLFVEPTQTIDTQQAIKRDIFTIQWLFQALGIFWLAGALIFAIKMIGGYFYTRSLINISHSSIPPAWAEFVQKHLMLLNIKKQVKVFENIKINAAFTFGFVKPVIALPVGFFTTLPAEQIEAVLLHELYHIKHKDFLINLLTMTLEVIFFYHPIMWWFAENIRNERENRCDDQVTQITDKQVYAHAILNMENYRQSMNYAIPFSNRPSNLKIRIMRIFEQKPEQNIGLKPFLSLLAIVVFLMGFTFYKLEEPKANSTAKVKTEETAKEFEELTSVDAKEEIIFKSENNGLQLVLEMTAHTLIAKTDHKEVKIYIDGEIYPLNEKISKGKNHISKMYHSKDESTYYFFSHQYFDVHNKDKWENEHKHLVTYHFDKPESKTFIIHIPKKSDSVENKQGQKQELEMKTDTNDESPTIKKVENIKSNLSEYILYGPVEILTENKIENLGDSNTLEVLKKLVRKFSKDKNADILIKINGELIERGADIETRLGERKIENIRIVLASEDADEGIIEIITDGVEENSIKEVLKGKVVETEIEEVPVSKAEETAIIEVPERKNTISIGVFYESNKGDFTGEMEMDVESESVLSIFGDRSSKILFVIDGIEKELGYKPGNDILPDDIKSITILKDKKAIEKYGEKAKNGVVEVYLKKK